MEIKGVDNLKNNFSVIKSSEESAASQKAEVLIDELNTEKIDLTNSAFNSKIKNLMQKMRTVQDKVSEQQSYLDSLNRARNLLLSNRDITQLFPDLMELRNSAKYNSKPLMENVISDIKIFYSNPANIKDTNAKVLNEIERINLEIKKSQQTLNHFNISIENIRASLNSNDISEMQSMLGKQMLYKNFNKELIISLMS